MYRDKRSRLLSQSINSPDWSAKPTKPNFEYLTELNGCLKVILTRHAKDQCQKRHGMALETMKTWFTDSQKVIGDIPVVEYNQEVFVYNRKWQRGMVLAFRRDSKNPRSDRLCLVVVTVYPYGKSVPFRTDTEKYVV